MNLFGPAPRSRTVTLLARRFLAAIVLTVAVFGVSLPVDGAEAAPGGYSSEQVQLRVSVNQTRRAHGLRPVTFHQVFANKAQTWADVLAGCQCLWHRNPPYGAVPGWYAVAETVDRGDSLAEVYAALLRSPPDRHHILTRRFTHVGTGVARAADGEVYVVLAFMDRTP